MIMKKLTEIRKDIPQYFVCINGINEFESTSIHDCKDFLIKHLKALKENGIKIENTYDYYIGMYTITIE